MSVTYPQYALSFPSEKEPAASLPTLELCRMPKLLLPLTDENGQPRTPLCELYDTVAPGQTLTDGARPLYAPVTGVFAAVQTIDDVEYMEIDALALAGEEPAPANVFTLSPDEIVAACKAAHVVDELDGADLADKLAAIAESDAALLVADAVDDQPFGSAGLATLRQFGAFCADGLMLAAKAAGIDDYHVLLRAETDTYKEIEATLPKGRLVRDRHDIYPHKVSKKGKPAATVGVQACLALYRACAFGEHHGFATVTVAGNAVSLPANVRLPFGTPLSEVFSLCGLVDEPDKYVLGDSFTGKAVDTDALPILPGVTCVLALKKEKSPAVHACIGCGRCAAVCHKHLLPYEIARRVENLQFTKLPSLSPADCDGCNACAVVCPANRPVADLVKQGIEESGRVLIGWGVHDYE
ncbi:MAG: 4Fe-4S dicluster domain-containing protein [Clostridia bacterium]|nr:4Fe-4S dicluster domain-containing protein [Clostridia bacterium]